MPDRERGSVAQCSVGLPVAGSGAYLDLALRSVLAQTFREIEILILFDGRPDPQLVARVEEFQRHDERIQIRHDGAQRGLASRLNEITRWASTDFICRMDDDDVMHPDRVRQQMIEMLRGIELCSSSVVVVDAATRPLGIRHVNQPVIAASDLLDNGLICHPSVMFNRAWALRNPYDEKFVRAQDKELWARALLATKYKHIEVPLLFYREVGRFRLDLYRQTQAMDRACLRLHGRLLIGFRRTVTKYLATFVKSAVYTALVKVGLEDHLVRRRQSVPLSHARAETLLKPISSLIIR